jgi:hypothetical protein
MRFVALLALAGLTLAHAGPERGAAATNAAKTGAAKTGAAKIGAAATPDAPAAPPWDAAPPVDPLAQRVPVNPGYGASFVFTRIRYHSAYSRGRGRRGGGSAWSHDYPRADWHLSTLLTELTFIRAETDGTNVLELDDPELFKYPVAYISEPGDWGMTDEQAERLREYVLKGGFLIFDDFEGRQFENMAEQLRRALPEYTPVQIGIDHPIFHSFFSMEDIYFPHPLVNVTPIYWGLFEDNDPEKRMLAIINHNNDIAEYWEWSADGWFPVDITNDAYKLGINYITFAMTH